MMRSLLAFTASVVVLAVFLGGGTRQGFIGDVVVQLAACALLVPSLWMLFDGGGWRRINAVAVAVIIAVVVLCLVQLLPWVPGLRFGHLRIPAVAGDGLAGAVWGARVSLTPGATWAGIVASIVPASIFLAVAQCDVPARLQLWRVVLMLGLISLLLGLAQVVQGPTSPLRFFAITNPTEAVGFFANRNHFAAELYVTLAFAAAWVVSAGRNIEWRKNVGGSAVISLAAAIGLVLLLTAGLAVARSRAGIVIAIGIVFGAGLIALRAPTASKPGKSQRLTSRTVLAALGFSVLFVVQLGLQRVIDRFQQDVAADLRIPVAKTTLRAALSALPFGTGIGSFPQVYSVIEDPSDLLKAYVNHAHNDFVEFFLEAGLPGAVLFGLFLVWFVQHAISVWTPERADDDETYVNVARAATLAIAGLLAHAFVDYGLRTTALAALFAVACGLLTPPPIRKRPGASRGIGAPRTRSRRAERPVVVPPVDGALPPHPAWPEDIRWPDAWKPRDETVPRR